MNKITGRLFVRSENDTEYRNWDDLTKAEQKRISECINREAAYAGGFRESRAS